ncbi:Serine/threonine-protein kinase PknB [Anatilimnocola aggregata]|uniref:non-specific serine/threonine protein kinase n=1 Tax=Anatilimnocola aggregata TaxID=2528021 RepID=A0A517YL00_9BACT|nr:protein kinase [Anatilimnocola aggregata]QDU30874.1 Serine/threonine-protein kinase PknB [Anatilimnocola aggregata]
MKPAASIAPEHPSPASLLAYGQGRLSPAEMIAVESHLGSCTTCCEALASTPDDTLLIRAREAATSGFRASDKTVPAKPAKLHEIPQPLRDHARYRVLGLLGAGGMGAVFKAEHRLMERMVALKVINSALVSSPAALERFEREVKTAAKLSHGNIVTAHDAEHAGDLHFLVMEFVDGASLDRLLAKTGPLPPQQAAHLIRQAALGLQHAHEKGMIHRDIKPQNLMVTRAGVLKILDFGLARLASQAWQSAHEAGEEPERPANATRVGSVLGTPDYIAPEQATDAHAADIRADIYSLGCTLYFLLAGEPPFIGGSIVDKLHAHKTCQPTPIQLRRPEVPDDLAAILERMMAKNPADRYARPADLAQALQPIARSRSLATTSTEPKPRPLPAATMLAEAESPKSLAGDHLVPELALPDLNAIDLGALPVVGKSLSGIHAKKPDSVPPLLWGGAIATAAALVITVAWLIFGGSGKATRQPELAKANEPPKIERQQQLPVAPPVSQHPKTNSSTSPKVVPPAVGNRAKILMIVPQYQLYYPDYANVKDALPNTVDLVTASSDGTICNLVQQSPRGKLVPDLKLSSAVRARDYDALAFAGYSLGELTSPGEGRIQTERLIREFQQEDKPIAAICGGQNVLAAFDLLTSETHVAGGLTAELLPDFRACPAQREKSGVVTSGKIITGKGADDGAAFARALVAAIR